MTSLLGRTDGQTDGQSDPTPRPAFAVGDAGKNGGHVFFAVGNFEMTRDIF